MKYITSAVTYIFHPLLMPTLGLLLMLNSGTYLSLLNSDAKQAILFVMALGTLVFPLMMIPIFHYRHLITEIRELPREEQMVPKLVILILYIITFVYFVRLPLSKVIHSYVLSVAITLLLLLLVQLKFNICMHSAALGGLAGLLMAMFILYQAPLQGVFILTLLAGGITATARIAQGSVTGAGVYSGYLTGFVVVLTTMLVY